MSPNASPESVARERREEAEQLERASTSRASGTRAAARRAARGSSPRSRPSRGRRSRRGLRPRAGRRARRAGRSRARTAPPRARKSSGVTGRRSVAFGLELGPELVEAVLGEREEDQPEHRPAVLGGREARVRAQLVGRGPESALELGKVGRRVRHRVLRRSPILPAPEFNTNCKLR